MGARLSKEIGVAETKNGVCFNTVSLLLGVVATVVFWYRYQFVLAHEGGGLRGTGRCHGLYSTAFVMCHGVSLLLMYVLVQVVSYVYNEKTYHTSTRHLRDSKGSPYNSTVER